MRATGKRIKLSYSKTRWSNDCEWGGFTYSSSETVLLWQKKVKKWCELISWPTIKAFICGLRSGEGGGGWRKKMCHVIEPNVKVLFLYLTMPACCVKTKNQLVRCINIPAYVLLRAHDRPSPNIWRMERPRVEILVLWTCITRIRPRLVLLHSLDLTLLFAHPFCGKSSPTLNPYR